MNKKSNKIDNTHLAAFYYDENKDYYDENQDYYDENQGYYDENIDNYDDYDYNDDNYDDYDNNKKNYQEEIKINQSDEDDLTEEEREYLKYIHKNIQNNTNKKNPNNNNNNNKLKSIKSETQYVFISKNCLLNLDYITYSYIFSFLQPIDIICFIHSSSLIKNKLFGVAWKTLCLRDFPFVMNEQEEDGFMNDDNSYYELYKKYFLGRKKNIFELKYAVSCGNIKRNRFEELLSCAVIMKSKQVQNTLQENKSIMTTIFLSHTVKDNMIKIWELKPGFIANMKKEHNLGYFEEIKTIKSLYNEIFAIILATNQQNQKDILYLFNIFKPLDYTQEKRIPYEKKLIIDYQKQGMNIPNVEIINNDPVIKTIEMKISYDMKGRFSHCEFDEYNSILYLIYNYSTSYFLIVLDLLNDFILNIITLDDIVEDIKLLSNGIYNDQSKYNNNNSKINDKDEVNKMQLNDNNDLFIICKSKLLIIDKTGKIMYNHSLNITLSTTKFVDIDHPRFKHIYIINDTNGNVLAFNVITREVKRSKNLSIIYAIRVINPSKSFKKCQNSIYSHELSLIGDNDTIEILYSSKSNISNLYYDVFALDDFFDIDIAIETEIKKSKLIYSYPFYNWDCTYYFYEFDIERYLIIEYQTRPKSIRLLNIYSGEMISREFNYYGIGHYWNIIYSNKKVLMNSIINNSFCNRKSFFIDLANFYSLNSWLLYNILDLGYYKIIMKSKFDDNNNNNENKSNEQNNDDSMKNNNNNKIVKISHKELFPRDIHIKRKK